MVLPGNLNTKEHADLSPIYQFICNCICSACKLFVSLQISQILYNFHLVVLLDESSVVICLWNLGELGFYLAFGIWVKIQTLLNGTCISIKRNYSEDIEQIYNNINPHSSLWPFCPCLPNICCNPQNNLHNFIHT